MKVIIAPFPGVLSSVSGVVGSSIKYTLIPGMTSLTTFVNFPRLKVSSHFLSKIPINTEAVTFSKLFKNVNNSNKFNILFNNIRE